MRTGIAYATWLDGDPAALATALELLDDEHESD